MKVQPWAAATAAFAAGSLAAVGIAQATSAPTKIPDSSTGVITACFVKKTGAVRYINAQAGKTCKSGEKKVTFNKTGPTGITGATGATGATGERGPSNTFVKANTTAVAIDDLLVLPSAPPKNRVVTLTLQAGTYSLNASTSIKTSNATTAAVTCTMDATVGTVSSTPAKASFDLAADQWQSLAVTGTLNTTGDTTVFLRCAPEGPGLFTASGASNGATITATKVADVTVQ